MRRGFSVHFQSTTLDLEFIKCSQSTSHFVQYQMHVKKKIYPGIGILLFVVMLKIISYRIFRFLMLKIKKERDINIPRIQRAPVVQTSPLSMNFGICICLAPHFGILSPKLQVNQKFYSLLSHRFIQFPIRLSSSFFYIFLIVIPDPPTFIFALPFLHQFFFTHMHVLLFNPLNILFILFFSILTFLHSNEGLVLATETSVIFFFDGV